MTNLYDEAMIGRYRSHLPHRNHPGPVSSLYGSNALFAVINIITKHGGDLQGLELSSSAASFNTYQGRISYGRKLRDLEFLVSGSFYGSRGHNQLYFSEFETSKTNYGIASHAIRWAVPLQPSHSAASRCRVSMAGKRGFPRAATKPWL